jgi:hypothetical protein
VVGDGDHTQVWERAQFEGESRVRGKVSPSTQYDVNLFILLGLMDYWGKLHRVPNDWLRTCICICESGRQHGHIYRKQYSEISVTGENLL